MRAFDSIEHKKEIFRLPVIQKYSANDKHTSMDQNNQVASTINKNSSISHGNFN